VTAAAPTGKWPLAAIATSSILLALLVVSLVIRIVSNNTPGQEGLPATISTRPNSASRNAAPAGGNDIPIDNESSLCQSNLKQIALSLLQYAQDNDHRFPPSKSLAAGQIGWADAIQPYLKSTAPLRCPLMPPVLSNSPGDAGYTDYYYNRSFDNVLVSSLGFPANSILLGDGAPGDARYARTEIETVGTPPADTRHQSGANYAFADGHVKWLFPAAALPATVPVNKSLFSHSTG
jgi:prepilin-type processing-associated H-X9-DG protein